MELERPSNQVNKEQERFMFQGEHGLEGPVLRGFGRFQTRPSNGFLPGVLCTHTKWSGHCHGKTLSCWVFPNLLGA